MIDYLASLRTLKLTFPEPTSFFDYSGNSLNRKDEILEKVS